MGGKNDALTIRFLESGTGTASSVLLWFTTTRIRYQQVTVVPHQSLSEFILGALVNVFSMVGHNRLGNGRSDSVYLCGNTSSLNSDANIKSRELVLSHNKHRLEHLQAKCLGLDILNGLTIDLDQTTALLGKGNCCGRLLPER